MKILFKIILKYYLKYITKLVLLIHRPLIIGVTGSINVIFTKNEIKRQLTEANYEVRSNPKNFNTEIGLPLAILNLPSGYNSYKNWLPVIWRAFKSIFELKFPKILVLGLGVAGPGDMKYLMSLARPKIAVITDITQRYIESFDDMDELVGEYKFFVKSIKKDSSLILNYDNIKVRKLAEFKNDKSSALLKAPDKTIFFGLSETGPKNYWRAEVMGKTLNGQTVRATNNGQTADYQIDRFGQHHVYALLVGLIVKKILSLKETVGR